MGASAFKSVVGRVVALLLIVRAMDAIVRATTIMRYLGSPGSGLTPPEIAVAGVSVCIYCFLAATLWGRPQILFGSEAAAVDTEAPFPVRYWVKVGCALVGVMFIADGLLSMAKAAFGPGIWMPDFGFLRAVGLPTFVPPLIQIAFGVVALIVASSVRNPFRGIGEAMFPPKTDYYSQMSEEEKEAMFASFDEP